MTNFNESDTVETGFSIKEVEFSDIDSMSRFAGKDDENITAIEERYPSACREGKPGRRPGPGQRGGGHGPFPPGAAPQDRRKGAPPPSGRCALRHGHDSGEGGGGSRPPLLRGHLHHRPGKAHQGKDRGAEKIPRGCAEQPQRLPHRTGGHGQDVPGGLPCRGPAQGGGHQPHRPRPPGS